MGRKSGPWRHAYIQALPCKSAAVMDTIFLPARYHDVVWVPFTPVPPWTMSFLQDVALHLLFNPPPPLPVSRPRPEKGVSFHHDFHRPYRLGRLYYYYWAFRYTSAYLLPADKSACEGDVCVTTRKVCSTEASVMCCPSGTRRVVGCRGEKKNFFPGQVSPVDTIAASIARANSLAVGYAILSAYLETAGFSFILGRQVYPHLPTTARKVSLCSKEGDQTSKCGQCGAACGGDNHVKGPVRVCARQFIC